MPILMCELSVLIMCRVKEVSQWLMLRLRNRLHRRRIKRFAFWITLKKLFTFFIFTVVAVVRVLCTFIVGTTVWLASLGQTDRPFSSLFSRTTW